MADYQVTYTGTEVQYILDQVNNKTVYSVATSTADGLMSKEDKDKLDSSLQSSFETITPSLTWDSENSRYSCDTNPYEQIAAAWSAGKIPVLALTLTQHTANISLAVFKTATNEYVGSAKAYNGRYIINVRVMYNSTYVYYDDMAEVVKNGTTENRPTSRRRGTIYFDTDLGKPIFWNGSAWVDATGATV